MGGGGSENCLSLKFRPLLKLRIKYLPIIDKIHLLISKTYNHHFCSIVKFKNAFNQ